MQDLVKYRLYLETSFQSNVVPDEILHVRNAIFEFINPWIEDYLWQLEDFKVQCNFNDGYLHGATRFGDNIEDEWFIVFLLREISRKFPELIVSVEDSDGEFLLIAAAMHLPEWINPETAENRVYLHKGALHIVPREFTCKNAKQAIKHVLNPVVQSRCGRSIQRVLHERLQAYPGCLFENPGMNHHYCTVALPSGCAHVLRLAPHLIGKAIDAFYHRDLVSLRAARKMKCFTVDKTPIFSRIRFTRPLYAQLDSQKFDAPKPFRLAGYKRADNDPKKHAYDLGVKIACGLEILYQDGKPGNVETSANLTVDDVCIPENRAWVQYQQSLKSKGFYGDYLEHSKPWNERQERAKAAFFATFQDRQRTTKTDTAVKDSVSVLINELKNIPFNAEDFLDEGLEDDDTSWMVISTEDLENMMKPWKDEDLTNEDMFMGKAEDDEEFDLNNFVGSMHNFMDMLSGIEGIDLKAGGVPSSKAQTDAPPPEWAAMLDAMDRELKQSKIGDGMEEDEDIALAKNFVRSFEAQQGRVGPVSTLANSMGIGLPFDAVELD